MNIESRNVSLNIKDLRTCSTCYERPLFFNENDLRTHNKKYHVYSGYSSHGAVRRPGVLLPFYPDVNPWNEEEVRRGEGKMVKHNQERMGTRTQGGMTRNTSPDATRDVTVAMNPLKNEVKQNTHEINQLYGQIGCLSEIVWKSIHGDDNIQQDETPKNNEENLVIGVRKRSKKRESTSTDCGNTIETKQHGEEKIHISQDMIGKLQIMEQQLDNCLLYTSQNTERFDLLKLYVDSKCEKINHEMKGTDNTKFDGGSTSVGQSNIIEKESVDPSTMQSHCSVSSERTDCRSIKAEKVSSETISPVSSRDGTKKEDYISDRRKAINDLKSEINEKEILTKKIGKVTKLLSDEETSTTKKQLEYEEHMRNCAGIESTNNDKVLAAERKDESVKIAKLEKEVHLKRKENNKLTLKLKEIEKELLENKSITSDLRNEIDKIRNSQEIKKDSHDTSAKEYMNLISALREKNEELYLKIETYEDVLKEKEVVCKDFACDKERLTTELTKTTQIYDSQQEEFMDLIDNYHKTMEKCVKTESHNNELRFMLEEKNGLCDDNMKLQQDVKRLQLIIDNDKNNLAILKEELELKTKDLEDMNSKVKSGDIAMSEKYEALLTKFDEVSKNVSSKVKVILRLEEALKGANETSKQYEEELSKLSEDLKAALNQKKELEAEYSEERNRFKESEDSTLVNLRQIESEKEAIQNDYLDLIKKFSKVNMENEDKWKGEYKEINDMKEKINQLNELIASQDKQIQDEIAGKNKIANELRSKEEELSNLSEMYDAQQNEMNRLKESSEKSNEDKEGEIKKIAEMEKKMESLDEIVTQKDNKIQDDVIEMKKINEMLASKEEEVVEWRKKITALQFEVTDLTESNRQYEDKTREEDVKMNEMEETIRQLKKVVSDKEKQIQDGCAQNDSLTGKEKELEGVVKEKEALRKDIKNQSEEITDLKKKLDDAIGNQKEAENELEEAEKNMTDLSKELSKNNELYDDAKKEISSTQKSCNEELERLKKECESIEQNNLLLKNEINLLKEEQDALKIKPTNESKKGFIINDNDGETKQTVKSANGEKENAKGDESEDKLSSSCSSTSSDVNFTSDSEDSFLEDDIPIPKRNWGEDYIKRNKESKSPVHENEVTTPPEGVLNTKENVSQKTVFDPVATRRGTVEGENLLSKECGLIGRPVRRLEPLAPLDVKQLSPIPKIEKSLDTPNSLDTPQMNGKKGKNLPSGKMSSEKVLSGRGIGKSSSNDKMSNHSLVTDYVDMTKGKDNSYEEFPKVKLTEKKSDVKLSSRSNSFTSDLPPLPTSSSSSIVGKGSSLNDLPPIPRKSSFVMYNDKKNSKKSDTPLSANSSKSGKDAGKNKKSSEGKLSESFSWLSLDNNKNDDDYSLEFNSGEEVIEDEVSECGDDDIDLILGGLEAFDKERPN